MENKTDRRILRTRAAIKEAFFSLLETKPIEKITVRELCDRADINRSSFYDHYLDYPDFLDAMEREYAEELLAQFDELFVREGYPEVTMRKLLHLIRHSREAELLLSNVSSHNALRIFEESLKERAFQDWLKYGEITKAQAEYLFCYIVSGGFAVIQQWYQGGFAESEEEIQKLLTEVITRGLYSFIHTKRYS